MRRKNDLARSHMSVVRAGICVLLSACLMLAFTGCRDSDTLKEIVYDQTSATIDQDNPDKIYINDSSSEETTDKLPSIENDKDGPVTDEKQSLVVYGSSPNTNDVETKQSLYDNNPQFDGIEASSPVSFYYSEEEDVSDHEVPHESDESENTDQIQYAGAGEPSPDEPSAGSDGNDQQSTNDGDAGTGEQKKQVESDDGGSDDGDFDSVYDASDPNQKPPKVNKLAAYGPYATIVAMIGGTGALVATDSATLGSSFSKVFDCTGIKKGWTSSGALDVNAVINSGANSVLVRSQPSASDAKKLKNAKVNVTLIGDLATSQEIKEAVTTIGDMLSESSSIQYKGKTQSRAAEYVKFHDSVVKAASDANGGLAQASGCGQLQKSTALDKTNKSFSSDSATYTALVVEFDSSARFTGTTYSTWSLSDPGLAFGRSGCSASPVAYYMQAGGLVDNCAYLTQSDKSGGLAPLWQFYTFDFDKSEWTGSSVSKVTSSYKTIYQDDRSLPLTTKVNETKQWKLGESFGTDTFPKLIAKNSSIKQSILSNSAKLNSSLHPFGYISSAVDTRMGPDSNVVSCIGFSPSGSGSNPLGISIPDSVIEVQPTGLFSDWTEGTVESFLESAWVNDVAKGNSRQVDWMQQVQNFYHNFYGYDLTSSDWNTITKGA